MYSLPFAELNTPWVSHHSNYDVLVNDLDEFPPLHLPAHHLPTSSSSPALKQREVQDWQFINGLSFSPKRPSSQDGEDAWEDIHYSAILPHKSFAEIAESAGLNDHPIPNGRFIHWPKHFHRRHRQRHSAQSAGDDVVHSSDDDDSFEDIFDHAKSRSRISARRVPFIHQRKRRLCGVVFRREIRSLTATSEKEFDTSIKIKQELNDTRVKLRQNNTKWYTFLTLAKQEGGSIRRTLLLDLVVQELEERNALHVSNRKRSKTWDPHHPAILRIVRSGFRGTDKWTTIYKFLYALFSDEKKKLLKQETLLVALLGLSETYDSDPIRPIIKKMSKRGFLPYNRSLRKRCVEDLVCHLKHTEHQALYRE